MIDVHAHYLPEGYRAALAPAGHDHPDGMPAIPEWSAIDHLALMDRLGIEVSMLSVSSPGVWTAELAREVNEEGRRAVVDHPGRFGLFASLPLPDVDAAMREIAYSSDRLDADGFVMLTNSAGVYVGDPSLAPVMRELDRRGARVFIHPTSPPCWQQTSFGRPRPMVEFLLDTTRCVVDLVLGGTVANHPGIEFIIPHAGAALAMVADRVNAFSQIVGTAPDVDVMRDLARLHFDLAGFPLPRQLDALRSLTTDDHLHYGSDFPFTPGIVVAGARKRLAEVADLLGSLRANSERLFPRLAHRYR